MNMKNDFLRQLAVIVTTVFALVMNGAANAIPLNGKTTAAVSDSFNVLFVPAGYVFSIWGLIYILLLAYTVFHSLPAQRANDRLRRTGWLVSLGSLANGVWIYFWHYGYYELTLLTMLLLLATLVMTYLRLGIGRARLIGAEKWCLALPFSVYLGWITVATIANLTDLLAYWGWNGGGISPQTWTLILLAAGVVIAGVMAFTRSDIGYLLVLAWAFAGISVRWQTLPVLNLAGYIAAGLVLALLVVSRLPAVQKLRLPAAQR